MKTACKSRYFEAAPKSLHYVIDNMSMILARTEEPEEVAGFLDQFPDHKGPLTLDALLDWHARITPITQAMTWQGLCDQNRGEEEAFSLKGFLDSINNIPQISLDLLQGMVEEGVQQFSDKQMGWADALPQLAKIIDFWVSSVPSERTIRHRPNVACISAFDRGVLRSLSSEVPDATASRYVAMIRKGTSLWDQCTVRYGQIFLNLQHAAKPPGGIYWEAYSPFHEPGDDVSCESAAGTDRDWIYSYYGYQFRYPGQSLLNHILGR